MESYFRKRERKSVDRRMKRARFPYVKTLDEFQLEEQTALSERQLKQLSE
ncbi:hypothetical protein [Bacillus xiapuensis]|nr:hypothetical protein [Bacillus xiapuensis]